MRTEKILCTEIFLCLWHLSHLLSKKVYLTQLIFSVTCMQNVKLLLYKVYSYKVLAVISVKTQNTV